MIVVVLLRFKEKKQKEEHMLKQFMFTVLLQDIFSVSSNIHDLCIVLPSVTIKCKSFGLLELL